MIAFLLMVFVIGPHSAKAATKTQKCINRQIVSALEAEDGRVDVRVVDSYFEGIHKKSFKTCFDLRKGDAFEIIEERKMKGKQMYKIRDLRADIYQWIPRDRMAYVAGSSMKVKDAYFNKAHGTRVLSCFDLKQGTYYPVATAKVLEGKFMIEVQDPTSGLLQWLPPELLEVKDKTLVQKCANAAKAGKP